MRRCGWLSIVVPVGSKHMTRVEIAELLLKDTLMVLSSVSFMLGESRTVIADVKGNFLANGHHQEGRYVSRCSHDIVHVG